MSLFGPDNFSNIMFNSSSVKEDSINLALHVLNMSILEYNSLSKDELLERKKQSLMCSSHIMSALNILSYYKNNNITNSIIDELNPLKILRQTDNKKSEFNDLIEPRFNPYPFKSKDLNELNFNTNYTSNQYGSNEYESNQYNIDNHIV
jgi:hypothetical protein